MTAAGGTRRTDGQLAAPARAHDAARDAPSGDPVMMMPYTLSWTRSARFSLPGSQAPLPSRCGVSAPRCRRFPGAPVRVRSLVPSPWRAASRPCPAVRSRCSSACLATPVPSCCFQPFFFLCTQQRGQRVRSPTVVYCLSPGSGLFRVAAVASGMDYADVQ